MNRSLLPALLVMTLVVFTGVNDSSAQAQPSILTDKNLVDLDNESASGLFSIPRLPGTPGVRIPDQGSILIGGIMASPEVYFQFPGGASILMQSVAAGQSIVAIGGELGLVVRSDRSENRLVATLFRNRPINDADNRPPLSAN